MIIDPYTWHSVRVTHISHDSVNSVRISTERPADYVTHPGQHAIIRITMRDGSTRLRQYSYTNAPTGSFLEFAITRSPGGDVSNWFIDDCDTTAIIDISQPFTGPLDIDTSSYKRIGLVGGGSGIAPLIGHIQNMREIDTHTITSLIYSTRSNSRLAHDTLQSSSSREEFTVHESDIAGRLTNKEILDRIQDCDLILICGSRQFVTAIRNLCHTHLPKCELRAEAFSLI